MQMPTIRQFRGSLQLTLIVLINCNSSYAANKDGRDDIVFQPLHTKCKIIKKELTHPNLNVTYSARPRKHLIPKIWMLRWQKIYIPIPQKKYVTLIIFNYHNSVQPYAKSPGFILIAQDGTTVVAFHYFKTLKYVYTNGVNFALRLPPELKTHPVFRDLQQPEISTSSQNKMFSYYPAGLDCERMNERNRTIMTALLMVKLNYSLGKLISVYKSMGGYSGWVSKEKVSLKQNNIPTSYLIWKGFYSRAFSNAVVNHVRIYSPANQDINNLALTLGYFYKAGYNNRPDWLYRFEKLLYRNTADNRVKFRSAIKRAKFDSLSQRSAHH